MKTIEQMTHDEVVALGEGDLEKLVRWACAEAGLKWPGPLPPKPEKPVVVPDVAVFKVGDLCFEDRAAAEAVAEAVAGVQRSVVSIEHDWQVSSEARYVKRPDDYNLKRWTEVATERHLTPGKYADAKEALVAHKRDLEEWEKLDKERREATAASKDIRESIEGVHGDACARERELERERRRFSEYLELASGDGPTAGKFYLKAHSPSAWVRERLFPAEATA